MVGGKARDPSQPFCQDLPLEQTPTVLDLRSYSFVRDPILFSSTAYKPLPTLLGYTHLPLCCSYLCLTANSNVSHLAIARKKWKHSLTRDAAGAFPRGYDVDSLIRFDRVSREAGGEIDTVVPDPITQARPPSGPPFTRLEV